MKEKPTTVTKKRRVKSGDERRADDRLFREIFDKCSVGLCVVGPDARYTHVNPRYAEMMGYEPDELVGRLIYKLTPPEEREALVSRALGAIVREVDEVVLERRYLRKDGSTFLGRTRRAAVMLDEESPEFFIVVVEDVDEEVQARAALREAKEAVEHAARQQGDLFAAMSHEVRTPMNGVLGTVDLLLESGLDERQLEFVQTIRRSGEQMMSIINGMLDFSRIDSGRVALETEDFDLAQIVEEVTGLFRGVAHAKGVVIDAIVAPGARGFFRGDSGRLRHVLVNLVDNAIKFTDEGSVTVTVTAPSGEAPEQKLRFEVEDSGIGISPDQRERIFDAFEQADASTTNRFGGTGLGLAIAQRIVALMEGEIGVASGNAGGSIFWFEIALPRSVWSHRDSEEGMEALPVAPTPGLRVLAVEDNAVNQQVLRHMLGKLGYGCELASDGIEALACVRGNAARYDMILMDCRLPGLDGYETARAIRELEDPAVAGIPILAVTASAGPGEFERIVEAGMDDYLRKPIRLDALARRLHEWVGGRPSEVPAFDAELTRQRADGNDDLADALFDLMAERIPGFVESLRSASSRQAWRELEELAHSIFGCTSQIGAAAPARTARRIETMCQRSVGLDVLGPSADVLVRELEELRTELLQHREPSQSPSDSAGPTSSST